MFDVSCSGYLVSSSALIITDLFPSLHFFPMSSYLSPTFHSNPWLPFRNKGVCWRASLHAVLCHQTANGEGTHRLHHWRGTLFPQWGQTHPTADWIQDAGESLKTLIKKKKGPKCCQHSFLYISWQRALTDSQKCGMCLGCGCHFMNTLNIWIVSVTWRQWTNNLAQPDVHLVKLKEI